MAARSGSDGLSNGSRHRRSGAAQKQVPSLPRISEERWASLHPRLIDVVIGRLGRRGAVQVTDFGVIVYYAEHEPR